MKISEHAIDHAGFQNGARGRIARNSIHAASMTGLLLLMAGGISQAQAINVTLNGDPVPFQGLGPQQVAGRVLVPVRGVLEKLGAHVAWMPQTQTVVASNAQIDIQLHIGDRHAQVNGKDILMDVPAQSIQDHTMVPLRFLGEALGAKIGWNEQTRTVSILSGFGAGSGEGSHIASPTPHPAPANAGVAPTINSFDHGAQGWLKPGEPLRVTMEGTPGSQATFRVPGLIDDIAMKETRPGHYEGAWVIPGDKKFTLSNAAVIGSLKNGDHAAPLIQAAGAISVDAVPPTVKDRAPEPGSKVSNARPTVYAVFDDQGSGVDKSATRILLNGKDVTQAAEVTPFFVSYTPGAALESGEQTVQVVTRDVAGNKTESVWHFTTELPQASGIRAVKNNFSKTLEPGDTLHVEMTGTNGGNAFFSVGSIKNVKMQEDQPGHYVSDYTIRKGDDVTGSKLAVQLATRDGGKFVQQSENTISVTTGKPMNPVITSPTAKAGISDPLVIRGKGTPNTKVHVKLSYKDRVLGVLGVQGTAADMTVEVDKNGLWETAPISLKTLFATRNVDYTITATSVNAVAVQSDPTSLGFRLH